MGLWHLRDSLALVALLSNPPSSYAGAIVLYLLVEEPFVKIKKLALGF